MCCALLLVPALLVQADDQDSGKEKPAAKKKEPNEGTKALSKLVREYLTKARTETDNDERKKLGEQYADKFLDHARKYSKDSSAFPALMNALALAGKKSESKTRKDALALLEKQAVKGKPTRQNLQQLVGMGTDKKMMAIVEAVAKSNPDRLTRALALRALANGLDDQVELAENLDKEPRFRQAYEQRLGKEVVAKVIDNVEQTKKQAEKYRATVRKDFKDVLPDVSVGAQAPKTEAVDLKGKKVQLSDLKGKVVVLDFWATWCGPCKRMIPSNAKLVEDLEGKPFAFVSISSDEKKDTVTEFLESNKMPWVHWWQGAKGKPSEDWDINGIPTVYVIDHKGVIRHKQVGYNPKKEDAIGNLVKKLIKEAEADKKSKSG